MDAYDNLLKLLLIGDSGVGKTSLLLSFTDSSFTPDMKSTIGVDLKLKMINKDGKRVKLTIWDTAGQERFRTLTSAYYRGAQGVILVYDVTRAETFNNVREWLKEVKLYSTHEDIVLMLVANKIDLPGRTVPRSEGLAFAKSNSMLFIETSAKTREGVEQAFEELVMKILDTNSLLFEEDGRVKIDSPPESSCLSYC